MKKILAMLAIIGILAIPVMGNESMSDIFAKITKEATKTTPAEITITGTGLKALGEFDFVAITANGKTVKATIISWTKTQIIVTVPVAKTGIIIGIVILAADRTIQVPVGADAELIRDVWEFD